MGTLFNGGDESLCDDLDERLSDSTERVVECKLVRFAAMIEGDVERGESLPFRKELL